MIRKSQKKKLKVLGLTMLWLCGFTALISASLWWSNLREDTNLEIEILVSQQSNIDSYEAILNPLGIEEIDKVSIGQITNLIEDHPLVKVARVSKHFPSQIKIEIIERTPIAILNKEPLVLLDNQGYVLPEKQNTAHYNLPIMSNFNSESALYPIGKQALSIKVLQSIELLSKIKKEYTILYNNISELKITKGNEIELILFDKPTHVFLGNEKIDKRISILKEFEKQFLPNNISDFSYLDMRFENQIIAKRRHL